MENKLVNCKNCKYFIEKHIDDNSIHYQCQKNSDKNPKPLCLGLLEDCPLHLRTCYTEKGEDYGTNSKTRNH